MSTKRKTKKPARRAKPFKPTLPQAVAELTAAIQALASAQMEILQLNLRMEQRMFGQPDGIPPPPAPPHCGPLPEPPKLGQPDALLG